MHQCCGAAKPHKQSLNPFVGILLLILCSCFLWPLATRGCPLLSKESMSQRQILNVSVYLIYVTTKYLQPLSRVLVRKVSRLSGKPYKLLGHLHFHVSA